jgi:hypothetical protein
MRALADIAPARAGLAGQALLGALCGVAIALADVNALILSAAAIAGGFILRDFRAGAVLLVLLTPLAPSALFPHAMLGITGLNPLNVLLAGTLGACLLQVEAGELRRFLPRALLWLYLVPIAAAAALGARHVGEIAPLYRAYDLIAFDTVAGYLVEVAAKPLLLVAFGLLVGAATARSERPERLLLPAAASLWAMGAMVIAYVAHSGVALEDLASSESRHFLSALGLHANDLGRLFAFACALLLFTWAEAKGTGLKLLLLGSLALGLAALVLTFSRAGFLAFGVCGVLFVIWCRSARTFALAALALAAALLLPGAVYERIETGFAEGPNAISAGRIDGLWLPLLPEFLKSPLWGNGLGSILWSGAMRSANPDVVLGATTPHSAYLQALLDMGIVGLVLLCAYFAHVWAGFRALAADGTLSPLMRGFFQGAAAGLAGFLAAGVAGSSLTPAAEQSYLWLAIGMMYGLRARRGAAAAGAQP